jgi:acid phosphatase family membrane protein YuiD
LSLLLTNGILPCAAFSWLLAQVIKVLIDWRMTGTLHLSKIISNGGMPSAHTAATVSLALMIAFREGIGSTSFAISFILAIIVVNDAVGVRYQTGKQGKVINKILHKMLVEGEPLTDETLHELIGHTPTEAFFGAVIGIVMPLFFR